MTMPSSENNANPNRKPVPTPQYPSVAQERPVEVLHHQKGRVQNALIEKIGNELRLKLISSESNEWQSRIDLNDPLALLSPYMQVMMLALLWNDHPARVHILGLGGGRIPAFLRHHFPELLIDCTEIDPNVYDLAVRFFGFRKDARMDVIIRDGREYLATRSPADPYDVIFIDAFRGVGSSPLRLATQEFLRECKAQLRDGGVLVVNILPTGTLVAERLLTIRNVFRSVHVYRDGGALVVFATDAEPLAQAELLARADRFEEAHPFPFPFALMSRSLSFTPSTEQASPSTGGIALLTDATPHDIVKLPEAVCRHIGRNDQCPCGSGRKFKKCHGNQGTQSAGLGG